MTTNDKLKAVRAEMMKQGVDAIIVPTGDPHQNEYLPEFYKSRAWVSGFSGSAGTVVITMDHAGLWTDSRYFLQAEMQLADSEFVLHKLIVQGAPEFAEWLQKNLGHGKTIGFDSRVMALGTASNLIERFEKAGFNVNTEADPIGNAWTNRPAISAAMVFEHDQSYAGLSRMQKISMIRKEMLGYGADYFLVTALDDIGWLLNLRGRDIECNPVFISYVLISPEKVYLFVDPNKISPELEATLLADNIKIKDYGSIDHYLAEIQSSSSILISPNSISFNLFQKINTHNIIQKDSPVMIAKSIKNEIEQGHIRRSMVKDGIALTHFFMWLEKELAAGNDHTEYDLAQQLIHFRSQQEGYYGESFDAIIGYNGNGAIIHYKPEKETAAVIKPNGVLLVDSGGQYLDGTTDITRTIALSEPTALIKDHYTRVLKGHIGIATAIFPKGTRGIQLDILARQFLWEKLITYNHGTGHGVGFFMNVHEPPQGITNALGERGVTPIAVGTFTSNEPGFYLEGSHGIRIENLVLCHPMPQNNDFLYFETVTLFPIDKTMIDMSIMTPGEINWLNNYHAKVYNEFIPFLDEESKKWLQEKCSTL